MYINEHALVFYIVDVIHFRISHVIYLLIHVLHVEVLPSAIFEARKLLL